MSEQKKSAFGIIVVGLAFALVAFVLNGLFGGTSPRMAQMFSLGIVLGNGIGCLGCVRLAIAKGYPWYVGLVGVFSCLGLAVLAILKDKEPVLAR